MGERLLLPSQAREDTLEAVVRRAEEELGLTIPSADIASGRLRELGKFTHEARVGSLSEHEIDHVFVWSKPERAVNQQLRPDPAEVEDTEWVGLDDLDGRLKKSLEGFAAWFPETYELFRDRTWVDGPHGWFPCGTCEWGVSRRRLMIRPSDGIAGTLEDWSRSRLPWERVVQDIESVVVEAGVSAVTCRCMFANYKGLCSADFINKRTVCSEFLGYEILYVNSSGDMVADYSSLESVDLSGLDTSRVTDMTSMFYGCGSLVALALPAGTALRPYTHLHDGVWEDSHGTLFPDTESMLAANAARESGSMAYRTVG